MSASTLGLASRIAVTFARFSLFSRMCATPKVILEWRLKTRSRYAMSPYLPKVEP
jgi:hypothetical protein